MNALGPLLIGYLAKYCRGAAASRTQSKIARDFRGLGLAGTTTREIRDVLADLVDQGYPVGTCGQGAFLCLTGRDFAVAYRNLAVRMRAQGRRCRRFKILAREYMNGQKTWDFGETAARFADLEERPLLAAAAT